MNITVIGAGCGGQAIAGYLASRGNKVSLYNKSSERILPLLDKKEIELTGMINSRMKLHKITNNISEVVQDSKLIMVVTTATGHSDIAKSLAPYLRDGQTIVLNPGRTFGSLDFMNTLLEYGCTSDVNIAETNTLIYTTRIKEPGLSDIKGIKTGVALSVIPNHRTSYVLDMVREYYPEFYAVDNFLITSFGNIGAVFHPAITLMNKDRIKHKEIFEFYRDGVTKEVTDYMEEVDEEKISIARVFGVKLQPLKDWLCERYNLKEKTLYDALHNNPSYEGILAPTTFNMRYLTEDVPTGLVPLSELGKAVGVETTHIDELIDMASEELNVDFRTTGRTLEKLNFNPETIFGDLERIYNIEKIVEYKKIKEAA